MFDYKVGSKIYPKLKEVDDVLGGKAAWENVDSTQGGNYQGLRFSTATVQSRTRDKKPI
jgi:hypothetical protein